jgi:hypothetical protein
MSSLTISIPVIIAVKIAAEVSPIATMSESNPIALNRISRGSWALSHSNPHVIMNVNLCLAMISLLLLGLIPVML